MTNCSSEANIKKYIVDLLNEGNDTKQILSILREKDCLTNKLYKFVFNEQRRQFIKSSGVSNIIQLENTFKMLNKYLNELETLKKSVPSDNPIWLKNPLLNLEKYTK